MFNSTSLKTLISYAYYICWTDIVVDEDMIVDDECKDPDYVVPSLRNRNIDSSCDEDCIEQLPKEDNNDQSNDSLNIFTLELYQ